MSNQYFEHQELIKRFKLLVTKQMPSLRIFDRTVGLFYAKRVNGGIINYVPIKINRPGMADTYGLLKSQLGLIHVEMEFKTGNSKQTKDQKNWQIFIESMGGSYFLIRNEVEAVREMINYFGGHYGSRAQNFKFI